MEIKNEDVSNVSSETVPGTGLLLSAKNGRDFGRGFLKFLFSLGGLIVFILLVSVVVFWQGKNGMLIPGINDGGGITLSSKVAISSVGENAFGVLSDLSVSSSGSKSSPSESYAASSNGAATASDKVVAPATIAGQGGGGAGVSGVIYPYDPTYNVYVYKGESFTQSEAKMNVLKRTSGVSDVPASTLARALDFSLFDLGKLDSAKTSNLSFFEDKEFGYRTDIDLILGTASVYKNYEKWPNLYGDCKGAVCSSPMSLKITDLPGDEEIINAANAFLKEYQVDLSVYGTPEVNKNFMSYYVAGQEAYVPDEVSVVYPLVVDGKSVYESYGEVNGLNVNYDIRNKKISSMYNLMTHSYQSSAYEAEMDVAKILAAAGNVDGVMPLREDGGVAYKTVEIELDTPFLSYGNLWRYENNQSSEYLAPCLVFPVKNSSDAVANGRKRVIVPLIKDFINQNNGGPIRIMKGAAGAGPAVDDSAVSTPASTGSAASGSATSSGPMETKY